MEGCAACYDLAMHICIYCKIRFCDNHQAIHEKRNIKSHKIGLNINYKSLQCSSNLISREITKKANLPTQGYSSNHKMSDILDWYNKKHSSKAHMSLKSIKAEYLEHALAQKQIFIKAHTLEVKKILITSDSQYIISASEDKTIRIWNFQSKKQVAILKGHTDAVESLAISSDNNFVVSGSRDTTVRIWDLQYKIQVSLLQGHTSWVISVKITDLFVISASIDKTLRIWSLTTKLQVAIIGNLTCYHDCQLIISTDSRYIITPSDSALVVWNLSEDRNECLLRNDNKDGNSIISAITTDNRFVFSGYFHCGKIIMWSLADRKQESVLHGHTQYVTSLAITRDNKYLISSSADKTVRLWNIHLCVQEALLQEDASHVYTLSVTSDDKYVVYNSTKNTIRIFDIQNKELVAILQGHTNTVCTLDISSDNNYIVSGSYDHTVRVWSIKEKTQVGIMPGHIERITDVAITKDDKYIISSSWDCTVRIWDTQDNTQYFVEYTDGWARCLAITYDQKYCVFLGAFYKCLKVWSLQHEKDNKLETVLQTALFSIESIAITRQNKYVVAGFNSVVEVHRVNAKMSG